MQIAGYRSIQYLLDGISKRVCQSLVHKGKLTLLEDGDAVVRAFDESAILLFTLPERFFYLLANRDIPYDPECRVLSVILDPGRIGTYYQFPSIPGNGFELVFGSDSLSSGIHLGPFHHDGSALRRHQVHEVEIGGVHLLQRNSEHLLEASVYEREAFPD